MVIGNARWLTGGLNAVWAFISLYLAFHLWKINREDQQTCRYQWAWVLLWLGAAAASRATYVLGGERLPMAVNFWLRVGELYLWALAVLNTLLAAFFLGVPVQLRERLMWLPWLQFLLFLITVSFLRHDFYLVSINYAPVLLLFGWFLLQDEQENGTTSLLWYGIAALFLLFLLDVAMNREWLAAHISLPGMAIAGIVASILFYQGGKGMRDHNATRVTPPRLKSKKPKRKPGGRKKDV